MKEDKILIYQNGKRIRVVLAAKGKTILVHVTVGSK